MLMLLAAAQIYRLVVVILDMEGDGVGVEVAAGVQVGHVEHGVAAPDDVERWIEDVLRNGHAVSSNSICHPVMLLGSAIADLTGPGIHNHDREYGFSDVQ